MRILLADDHELVVDALRSYLVREADHDVVTAHDLDAALALMENRPGFDLILLDYTMPGMNGLEGLRRAIEAAQGRPVAIISGTASRGLAEAALAMGATGFLPKSMPGRTLAHAILFMGMGERFVPVDLLTAGGPGGPAPGGPAGSVDLFSERLTERERDVLRGLCQGQSNKEIARVLSLSEATVKLHVKTLYRRLGVNNRTQAALMAQQAGLVADNAGLS